MTPEQQWATMWGQQRGYLSPNETATGGLLASRIGGNADIMNEFNQQLGAFKNPASAGTSLSSGVMPIGIEPLHSGERAGYSTMLNPGLLGGGGMAEGQQRIRDFLANPQAATGNYQSPQAQQALQQSLGMFGKADTALQQGMSPIQESEFSRYMNPFQSQVIDTALAQLQRDYEKAQDQRYAELNTRPSASFGDLFGATRMAELDKQNMQSRAEIPAQYGYKGWQDTLSALQNERNRSLQAGQTYGGLGGSLGNIASQAQGVQTSAMQNALSPVEMLYKTGQIGTEVGYNTAARKIQAGGEIRGYNQNLSDIALQEYMNERAFPRQNLTQTMELIPSFATQDYVGVQPQTTQSTMSGIGNALSTLGGLGTGAFGTGTPSINNTAVGRWFSGL